MWQRLPVVRGRSSDQGQLLSPWTSYFGIFDRRPLKEVRSLSEHSSCLNVWRIENNTATGQIDFQGTPTQYNQKDWLWYHHLLDSPDLPAHARQYTIIIPDVYVHPQYYTRL